MQLANPGEITGLAFDNTSSHLAACNRNSVIQLFAIDTQMKTHVIFSITIDNLTPKAIVFGHMSGNARDLLTFNLYNGQMSVFCQP